MHIKTGPDIESERDVSRYLLPYQAEWVLSEDRYHVMEKANRTGVTFCDALRNVRLRLAKPGCDYLFTTQNWAGALEYGRYLDKWIEFYNLSAFILSRTEETMTFERINAQGQKVAVEEKVGIYTFDGGSRILLFPSSPWAIQTFEGDVGWDEAAFHDNQEAMWAAIATRLQWGYGVRVWSAHNGVGSWFNQVLLKQAKTPGSGFTHRKLTIYDAIADGLVEKINEVTSSSMTREAFLADCKVRAFTAALFAERFECSPSDSGTNITPWSIIEAACTQGIIRAHLSDTEVQNLFGMPGACDSDVKIKARMAKMTAWMEGRFGALRDNAEHLRAGYDVAASGEGDLGAMWISGKAGARLLQRALLTTQTPDWNFHKAALWWFMDLPAIKGCGDGSGLGRNITWDAAQRFSGRFEGVSFTRETKADMGGRVMGQLTSGEFQMASADAKTGHPDIGMDFFSLQKHTAGGALTFTATTNPLNKASHCDMAWAGILASHADATIKGGGAFGFSGASAASSSGLPGVGGFKELMRGLRRRVMG